MARKTALLTIHDENRDKGKIFKLTELPASRAEAWATRLLLALMDSGIDLPKGFEKTGMAGIAEVGFKALGKLKWDVAEPLLDEMWECVQIQPDPKNPAVVRALIEEDVEEVTTRIELRKEVLNLHMGFSKTVAKST